MTANAAHPSTISRVVNALFALALAAFVLANFWPTVKLFDLARADLQYQGSWIGGHAKRITAVTPGGVADRAGLKPGDVLEFDPARDSDWVLASYRNMPEGFTGTLPVRHADGTRSVVTLTPQRVAYLPTFNDRLALAAFLCGTTILLLLGVFLVSALPSLMTWSLLVASFSTLPYVPRVAFVLAFQAGRGVELSSILGSLLVGSVVAFIPFALCFPRNTVAPWAWWKQALGSLALVAVWAFIGAGALVVPFENDGISAQALRLSASAVTYVVCYLIAIGILAHTYRGSDDRERARLRWALLGFCAAMGAAFVVVAGGVIPFMLSGQVSASALTPSSWALAVVAGVFFPSALGMAVLRQRVIDVQFAVSRTLVYGAVTTLALAVVAAVHWVLGRMLEHSGLALGLEGAAAIGVGLVLHRGTHTINGLVDRVVFRKHHAAEERLRRVTAALPFATEQRSIAEALVLEPARNLNLASAALFYRESREGPLRRVLAQGWDDAHVESLGADSFLVRYLQAEHEPLKLDDPQLLPAEVPEGAALPVLAIPIVNQHALVAVVLYGSHTNSTLLDPDEIELLHRLAKAAATSHQQVRIGMLTREKAAADREAEARQVRIEEQERTIARLETLAQVRLRGAQG
jgi:hypothetical protein